PAAVAPSPATAAAQAPAPAPAAPGPAPGAATAQQLQEMVAPIALYPDPLIGQILAASTYPTQVVEASRWREQNPSLQGEQLAAAVKPQPWDPSVKSLTQFPSVLKTMSDSLTWTTSLGEAYYNQPADVLNAIQVMRKRAMDAGALKDTPQQKVEVEAAPPAPAQSAEGGGTSVVQAPQQTIVIEPAQPNTVYVPQYNPQTAYGQPVAQPAGYTGGEMLATGLLAFGGGVLLGSLLSDDDDDDWGCDWHGGNVTHNNNVYVNKSNYMAGRPGGRYPAAGVRPGAAGRYARATPYGAGGYNPNNPPTRRYNPSDARQIANRPNFPKAEQ